MLLNHLKIAFRTLVKFKSYAVINLLGLALGLTTGVLILMYVLDELSFDNMHVQSDRIYRVGTDIADIKTGGINGTIETNGWPVGQLLKKDYPEVEEMAYTRNGFNLFVNHEGQRFEERVFYASEAFFKIFSFPLLEGNPATALSQSNSVVITKSMERKFFGDQSALGKTLTFVDTLAFEVTGVMEDTPENSHMQFDMLVSFATYYTQVDKEFTFDDGWGNLNVRNYILLKEGVDKQAFFAKARNLYMDYVKADLEKYGMYLFLGFEPLKDVYLRSSRGNGMGPSGSIDRVYLVGGIALFVILLACINFVNLATARSTYRAKEVGLRKVVGSSRWSLIRQFLSESLVLTLLAFIISVALIGGLLPMFNQLVGKTYTFASLLQPELLIGIVALIIGITLLAGYYPAMVISALRPYEILKGKIQTSARGIQLRRALVVFQFAISTVLIAGTIIVLDQLDYMKNRDLGFFGDQVVVLNTGGVRRQDFPNPQTFKNEIKSLASVEDVTLTNAVPGRPGWIGQWAHAADKSADESIGTEYMAIDEDYIKTLGLTLVAGHGFDINRPAELEDGLVINEKTVQMMGWESPEDAIGKKIESPSSYPAGTVIGVVKDYHEFGLQKEIYPMAMDYAPRFSRYYAIKFNSAHADDVLASLETLWKKQLESYPFDYFFLNQDFERQYQSEQRLARVFTIFAVMTILIAVIGLIGLVSFMVVSKTKEIGVRKVLGANVASIAGLLTKEFLLLVLVANIIACPVAWYLSDQWLQDFAYHMNVDPLIFIVTACCGLLITLLAVGFQTIKAALADPVNSLRYE